MDEEMIRTREFNYPHVPEIELMDPGHAACQGCGGALAMRLVLKAVGDDAYIALPACCWTILAGLYPYFSLKVPLFHTAFATASIAAAGIRAGLDAAGHTGGTVIGWGGDGGTFDIGMAALSGCAERNENILYCVYDNEAYMNTGIQRSSATPFGAWTSTTPDPNTKAEQKKDILRIMAAHNVPYTATASIGYPEDLIRKAKKAASIKGFRFLHILAPCPPGWKIDTDDTIVLARLAVESRVFPLVEVENGRDFTLNYNPPPKPLADYLKTQGRFKSVNEDRLKIMTEQINFRWGEFAHWHERTHGSLEGIPADALR